MLAKNPPAARYITSYGPTANNLVLSPGDGNAEVVSEMTAIEESKLVYVQPHLHLRGKDMEVRVVYPTGETQTVRSAASSTSTGRSVTTSRSRSWLPKGSKVQAIAHFDNSANNRFNPDPGKEVVWGLQNWEEMQNCFMGFVIDSKIDPAKVFKASGPSLMKRTLGASGPTEAAFQPSDTK